MTSPAAQHNPPEPIRQQPPSPANAMTDQHQHCATDKHWAEQETYAFTCGHADSSCLLELRHRVELLEATQHTHDRHEGRCSSMTDAERNEGARTGACEYAKLSAWRATYLVEKVRARMILKQRISNSWSDVAEAVLNEVANWLRSEYPHTQGYGTAFADLLDNEAKR